MMVARSHGTQGTSVVAAVVSPSSLPDRVRSQTDEHFFSWSIDGREFSVLGDSQAFLRWHIVARIRPKPDQKQGITLQPNPNTYFPFDIAPKIPSITPPATPEHHPTPCSIPLWHTIIPLNQHL